MPGWLKLLLDNPLVAARVKAGIATASVGVGGWVLSHMYDWLMANATSLSHATDWEIAGTIATCAAGLIASAVGVLYPQKDVSNVDAKIKAVAATGEASAANDKAIVSQVKAADGTPEALNALIEKLKAGNV